MDTNDWLEYLGQYETICRSLVAEGNLRELEIPMRKWDELLKKAAGSLEHIPEYYYFVVIFEQLNGVLYQNTGQFRQMKEHLFRGKDAAEQLISFLPLDVPAEASTEAEKLMALNCGEFERTASLMLETIDVTTACEMLEQAAALYDWLWHVLQDPYAEKAAEIHLKLYSLSVILGRKQPENIEHSTQAVMKYEELYDRTGDLQFLCKGKNAQLSILLQKIGDTGAGYEEIRDFLKVCKELEVKSERHVNLVECRIRIQLLYASTYAALGTEACGKGRKQEAENWLQLGVQQLQSGMSLLSDHFGQVDDALKQELADIYLFQNIQLARYYYQIGQNDKAKHFYQTLLKELELRSKEIPSLSQEICKAQLYSDLAHMAMNESVDTAETEFYFAKAASSATKILQGTRLSQALYIAGIAFLGVAYYKQDKTDEAVKYAQNGLEICSMLEIVQSEDFTQKEINSMKQQFKKIISARKKPSVFGRLFRKKNYIIKLNKGE